MGASWGSVPSPCPSEPDPGRVLYCPGFAGSRGSAMGSWEPCTPAPPGSQVGTKSLHVWAGVSPGCWQLVGGVAGGTAERELTTAADFSLEGKTPHKRPAAWHPARAKTEAKTGSPGGWPALPLQWTLEDGAALRPAICPHSHHPPGCLLLIWKPLSVHSPDSVCLILLRPTVWLFAHLSVCGPPSGVHLSCHLAMAQGRGAAVSLVLLGLALALAIIVPAVVVSRHRVHCGPQAFAHAAVAADSKTCSDIGRAILQQRGSPVDAAIAALVCTGVVNPQSMGLGGGVIFTIYNATTGKVEVINARETVPSSPIPALLDQCEQAQPLGTGAQWIGVPGELRGYAEAHRRHGRLPWAQLFMPTIALLRGGFRVPTVLASFLHSPFLRPSLRESSLRQLFFNGTEPLRSQDPLPWPMLADTLETVAAEGAESLYTGRLGQLLLEDIAKEGSRLTLQDLASFQPEVAAALAMPLGDYTLYSPPPPAGGAILSFVLNVLKGFNFSAESVAGLEGRVNLYHHLVETLKFAGGQRWRLWDPRSHPEVQNASRDLLGEALAQRIRQQMDARGDHPLDHYSLAGAWTHRMGTAHVSVLGEDGSAVAATSTVNTPFGAMVYSPRTGILLNNELLDLCWRHSQGSRATPPPAPGERPPSSMVPSILVSTARGSKLVIGGAGGELIISAVAQAIVNKLWLGFDLQAAIKAPILHVDSKGQVEFEPSFSQFYRHTVSALSLEDHWGLPVSLDSWVFRSLQ
ncbi:glutathione hydrolase 5 proenzyme isoform X3 [Moschus berezovskii]|uniref:glutathione hydrolase 5 proenzyme isoform X3 n=1 Tax=Moschus berezovskii TaxID=68408 RepID=UPI0024445FDB|nr:glutathione hydrolase 5 proenzyme isoform X3 [Moschus berezovskii]